jgi:hypothetical protein
MGRISEYIGRLAKRGGVTTTIAVRADTPKEASDRVAQALEEELGEVTAGEKCWERFTLDDAEGRTVYELTPDAMVCEGVLFTAAIKGDRMPLGLVVLDAEVRGLVNDATLLDAVRRHGQGDAPTSRHATPDGVRFAISTEADPVMTLVMLDDGPA